MNLEIFRRLSPNFTLSANLADHVFVDELHIDDIGEIASWFKQIHCDDSFREHIISFIRNKNQKTAIILINSTINQVRCIFIYLLIRSQNNHKIEIEFYNLIELSNLIGNCFSRDLWQIIDNGIVMQHDYLIQRHLHAGYIALEPLFTLCHGDFQEYGKIKYDLGNVLFYLNHNYNWSRSNAGICANSGRVLIQQLSKSKRLANIPEHITRQCMANHQLEHNVFITIA
ncbi:MAG: hypothetical protein K2Q03_10495 [Sphingobacteriaceae bacterium]|nr:hypothetical protein [Sphingobacteriaceae bacterium]